MAGDEAVASPHVAHVLSLVFSFCGSRGGRLPCRAQPRPARIAQVGRVHDMVVARSAPQPPRSPGRTVAGREDVFLRPNDKSAGGGGAQLA